MQCAYQGLIYFHYTLNKNQITATYCENKAKPQLKCDGKCHLRKMLDVSETVQTDSSSELPPAPNLADLKPILLFFESFEYQELSFIAKEVMQLHHSQTFWYQFTYDYQYQNSSFEPPRLSA